MEVPVIVRTTQEITPSSARDYIECKENATTLPPVRPEGGTVFLYYNSGKQGKLTCAILLLRTN